MLDFMQIVLINLILSGDNAIVIAMASKNLPEAKRRIAIFWGASAAVILRIILTVVAIQLLNIPFIMTIGAILLFWIALKLLIDQGHTKEVKAAQKLRLVVMTIVMADFIMSLDNVLAIAVVAKGDLLLIVIGLALSIPILIWGSDLVLKLLDTYPVLVYGGAGLLGFTAGEMLLNDVWVAGVQHPVFELSHELISLCIALLVIIIGWLYQRYIAHR